MAYCLGGAIGGVQEPLTVLGEGLVGGTIHHRHVGDGSSGDRILEGHDPADQVDVTVLHDLCHFGGVVIGATGADTPCHRDVAHVEDHPGFVLDV